MTAFLGIYGIQDRGRFPVPRWTHDHGIALIEDGDVRWTIELERLTGVRHDNRLPDLLEALAESGTLPLPDDFEIVSVDSLVGRTFMTASGRWRVEADSCGLEQARSLQPARAFIGTKPVKAWVCPHELAHVGANLPFTSGFDDDSLLVHVDGGASQSNVSAFRFRNERIEYVHHGWDVLWPVLNFGHNDLAHAIVGLNEDRRMAAPGRLMGLAAYGTALSEMRAWLEENAWFREHWNCPARFFGAARELYGWDGDPSKPLDSRDPFLQAIVACIQAAFEDAILDLLSRLHERTGCRRLYYSGGAALNIDTNRRLLESGCFDEVHIPPCCSDSGLALGAAALASFLRDGPLTCRGPFLQTVGLGPTPSGGLPVNFDELARRLCAGQVVATCIGGAEVGPRALGHRSLLASPRGISMRHHVSEVLKRRDWYQPLAPMVLSERADSYFPGAASSPLAPFMLDRFQVPICRRAEIPAVVHVDGTARAQVVGHSPGLSSVRRLLEQCHRQHGLPCLINTSFNLPGRPIIHRAPEALETARAMGVDAVLFDETMFLLSPANLSRA